MAFVQDICTLKVDTYIQYQCHGELKTNKNQSINEVPNVKVGRGGKRVFPPTENRWLKENPISVAEKRRHVVRNLKSR